ncbi:MAG: ATP-dependent DNA helicase [Steroidobacteraceae bacterium]|jgi:ATP-dependent DNA helicase RecQ|nr:ATP-dependent DNA helicase [Steroidobacteraceae bacterium]
MVPANPEPMDTAYDVLDDVLHRLGYASFRPGQREAIETLLDRGRALLVAPTGGGKSLCYQAPALLLPGTTLVVSPLIALMQDQVSALQARGVAATFLASTLDAATARARFGSVMRGEYRLVYVAPERLANADFRARLAQLEGGVPLVAVDEAHCISEWGHDFRPEYLQIGELIRELAPAHVLACTATATPVVRDEILVRLGLAADTPQLVRGFARPNLSLRAVEVEGARDRERRVDAALVEALGDPRTRAKGLGHGAAIVYAPTRRQAEEEGARLGDAGWRVAVYHAGLDAERRAKAQAAFTTGHADVVCATNAFGMGIDRGDVRAVVHLGPPGSIEAYYQEVGRAGRDGADALGLLCWSQQDLPLRRRLLERPLDDGETPNADVVEHKWNLFLELVRWAEGGSCRHDAILRYFGDEAETLAGCGRCDVCTSIDAGDAVEGDATELARILLSGVARLHGRFGLKQVVRLLHGEPEERLERLGLMQVSTFGRLKDRPADWIQRALARCVTAGWVQFSGDEHPVVRLTDDGVAVMRGQRQARWLPPPASRPKSTGGKVARSRARVDARASVAGDGSSDRASTTGAARGAAAPGVAAGVDADLDAAGLALFDALRAARLELAQSQGVPAYVVAHDRTLRELARLRPTNPVALLQVPGFGPQKVERYGTAFLRVIAANP